MVIQDHVLLFAKAGLVGDLSVELTERFFGQTIILKVLCNFVVNVLAEVGFVTVLEFKFVDEHSFELLALLNVHKTLPALFTHARTCSASTSVGAPV